jgi:hypothetical protein
MTDMSALKTALLACGPAADRAAQMQLYGWLVGHWTIDVRAYDANGRQYRSRGEIYAGWVLEGRAIQDVWMIPPRPERLANLNPADFPVTGPWYGTTLRVYDPLRDVWNIHWIDPATGFQARMVGRAHGEDIVQEGTLENGTRLRWSFRGRRADAFRWTGEASVDAGKHWMLQVDIAAQRVVMPTTSAATLGNG